MLPELRKVIPAFLVRVDREDRGVRWSRYLCRDTGRDAEDRLTRELTADAEPVAQARKSRLTAFDPGR